VETVNVLGKYKTSKLEYALLCINSIIIIFTVNNRQLYNRLNPETHRSEA